MWFWTHLLQLLYLGKPTNQWKQSQVKSSPDLRCFHPLTSLRDMLTREANVDHETGRRWLQLDTGSLTKTNCIINLWFICYMVLYALWMTILSVFRINWLNKWEYLRGEGSYGQRVDWRLSLNLGLQPPTPYLLLMLNTKMWISTDQYSLTESQTWDLRHPITMNGTYLTNIWILRHWCKTWDVMSFSTFLFCIK